MNATETKKNTTKSKRQPYVGILVYPRWERQEGFKALVESGVINQDYCVEIADFPGHQGGGIPCVAVGKRSTKWDNPLVTRLWRKSKAYVLPCFNETDGQPMMSAIIADRKDKVNSVHFYFPLESTVIDAKEGVDMTKFERALENMNLISSNPTMHEAYKNSVIGRAISKLKGDCSAVSDYKVDIFLNDTLYVRQDSPSKFKVVIHAYTNNGRFAKDFATKLGL
jgi:hypothetical protein